MAIILLSSSFLNYSYCLIFWQQVVTEKNDVSNIHLPTSTTNSHSIHGENIPSHFPPLNVAIFCHPNFLGDKNPYIRRGRIWEMVQEKLDSKQNWTFGTIKRQENPVSNLSFFPFFFGAKETVWWKYTCMGYKSPVCLMCRDISARIPSHQPGMITF